MGVPLVPFIKEYEKKEIPKVGLDESPGDI